MLQVLICKILCKQVPFLSLETEPFCTISACEISPLFVNKLHVHHFPHAVLQVQLCTFKLKNSTRNVRTFIWYFCSHAVSIVTTGRNNQKNILTNYEKHMCNDVEQIFQTCVNDLAKYIF